MASDLRPPLKGLPGFVLLCRFLTELALLAGIAVAGARLGGGVLLGIGGAVVPTLAVAVLWGLFIGPRAKRRLPDRVRLTVECVLFAGAAVALAAADLLVVGIVIAATGILFAALTRVVAPGH